MMDFSFLSLSFLPAKEKSHRQNQVGLHYLAHHFLYSSLNVNFDCQCDRTKFWPFFCSQFTSSASLFGFQLRVSNSTYRLGFSFRKQNDEMKQNLGVFQLWYLWWIIFHMDFFFPVQPNATCSCSLIYNQFSQWMLFHDLRTILSPTCSSLYNRYC